MFAGAVEGETWMWKVPSGDCKTIPGFGLQNECGKVLPDGRSLKFGFNLSIIKFQLLFFILQFFQWKMTGNRIFHDEKNDFAF